MVGRKRQSGRHTTRLEKGLEEGRQVEARNIAQKMLARGLELELITHLTGLTQEELVALAH